MVGIFHYGHRHNYVTPIDQKIAQEIQIESSAAVPPPTEKPARQKSKHRVLGEEAARRVNLDDLENVVVDVEITDWPTATQNPRGRVVEVLGYEDDFGVDVEIIIRKFHLPHRFPAEVLNEAERAEPIISSQEARKRRDFRDLPIVTIDGETARDFDDAVTVVLLENGNFELQVHIADVAHYVTAGSALDQEARLRGTSVYFPDRAVPMLPLELSTDICSLRPQVDRLVMSCLMEIDHRGEIVCYELCEGIIKSAERMTYTDVNAVLEGDESLRRRYAPLVKQFELMRDLALILNRKRERRGSIDFDLPEPVIEFDEHGLMKSITRSERNIAHRLIEEFMLSANEWVASYLEKKRIASLYRIHEKPDAKRVYDFEVIAATFGYSLGVGALPIERMQLKTDRRANYGTGKRTPAIEIPKEVHITPRMYQKLTEKIAGKPEERILSYLMLRSLKQARYSEENQGHFALAAPTYTHFTSPIRRYPDLIVHRILKEVLRDARVATGASPVPAAETPSPWSKRREREALEPLGGPIPLEVLHEIAEESSQSERRADEAERELMEWKKAKFMEDQVGEDFDGLIISVTKFGFFVELTRSVCRRPGAARDPYRRPLHLSRKHARNHRTAQPQDVRPGTEDPRPRRPHRPGGEENPVRGARTRAAAGSPAQIAPLTSHDGNTVAKLNYKLTKIPRRRHPGRDRRGLRVGCPVAVFGGPLSDSQISGQPGGPSQPQNATASRAGGLALNNSYE